MDVFEVDGTKGKQFTTKYSTKNCLNLYAKNQSEEIYRKTDLSVLLFT